MRSETLIRCLMMSTGLMAVMETGAYAQSASNRFGGLEDIVVTARKRTESLIDVPVAVSAIGGEELQRQGVNDLTRIAQLAPQVILAQADSGTGASFSIRGLGTSFLDPGLDQSVAVVFDGAPVSRGNVVLMGMFDIAQVEILKGPQALFFGKNSPAGVVSLTSAGATDAFEGYVRAGYEFEAREKYAEAAVSGPLTDTLRGRLALRGTTMRGWLRNVAQPVASPLPPGAGVYWPISTGALDAYAPGNREVMGRVTLTWEPTSDFNATLKLMAGRGTSNGTTSQQYCDASVGHRPVTLGGLQDPYNDCAFDDRIAVSGIPPQFIQPSWGNVRDDGEPYLRLRTLLPNLTMNYDIDNLSLTSVTSYLDLSFVQNLGIDLTSYGLANTANSENTKIFSQELRLSSDYDGPVNFSLGGYYERQKRRSDTDLIVFFVGPDPVGGRYDNLYSTNRARGETLSAFGQLRWQLTPDLELAGGVRYTHEKRRQHTENLFVHPFVVGPTALGDLVPVGSSFDGDFTDSNWSPEFTLSYKPQPNLMAYAAYKTGYKSGGFPSLSVFKLNPDGSIPTTNDLAFGPERAKGGEAGIKARLLDRRLRVEATFYRYIYSGLQQSVFNPATFSFLIRNAASARIQGAEIETEWQANRELRLRASLSYNDARYTRYVNSGCYTGQTAAEGCASGVSQDLSGRRLPRAPKWNLIAGAAYDTSVGAGLMLGLNTDVTYSSRYVTQETQPPFAVQDGFTLWNAGVRVHTADDRYELALIGRNLTNKYYVQLSTSTTFAVTQDNLHAATPRPREVRLQGTYRF